MENENNNEVEIEIENENNDVDVDEEEDNFRVEIPAPHTHLMARDVEEQLLRAGKMSILQFNERKALIFDVRHRPNGEIWIRVILTPENNDGQDQIESNADLDNQNNNENN